jgi:hypothetical protein
MDGECVVDDAAQRARAVAAVMNAAAGSSEAEQGLGSSRVGSRLILQINCFFWHAGIFKCLKCFFL